MKFGFKFTLLLLSCFLLTPRSLAWPVDPLANINLFQGAPTKTTSEKTLTASESQKPEFCENPIICPVCPVVQEWPLDFDRDDLAEKAQLRKCSPDESGAVQEMLIVFSHTDIPSIYIPNRSCKTGKPFAFSHFERVDFNRDNYDELIFAERDLETGSERVKVLGYHLSHGRVIELPLIEYETDLRDFLGPDETLEGSKLKLEKLNAFYGFILSCQTERGRSFQIGYYQDAADRAFYPLKIAEQKRPALFALQAKPASKVEIANGIELIQ